MAILVDTQLRQWAASGGVTPFSEDCINPASLDLRWSGRYKLAKKTGWGEVQEIDFNCKLHVIRGDFLLLDTLEFLTIPDDCAGELMLKSSLGRKGMEHLHAGYFDPGFSGTATLEIENRAPFDLVIERGQRIVQIALHRLEQIPERTYQQTGRYNGQSAPQEAK